MSDDFNSFGLGQNPEDEKKEETIFDSGQEDQQQVQSDQTAAPAAGQSAQEGQPSSQWQSGGSTNGYYQPSGQGSPYQQPPYQGYGSPFGQQPPQGSPFQMNGSHPQQDPRWNVSDYQNQPQKPQKPKKNKGLIAFSVVLAVALVFTIGSFVIYAVLNGPAEDDTGIRNTSGPSLTINSRPSENAETTEDGTMTDTAIAKKVKPSVVGIVAYVKMRTQYQVYGEGSGIIMSKDGYIITNAHVVSIENSNTLVDKVQVYLDNGESYGATIVGADSRSDLAVLKIKASNLTPAEFGDSTKVEVGEHVLAIGNPSGLALAGSVTGGMVSAVNRNIKSSSSGFSMTCIQTDAAINPGNSGGALVNVYGQVIGINSSKISATDYEGIGFAIAINEAKPIVESIIANGYVEGRVKIGITYQEVDAFTAALNQVPQGLEVVSIDSTLDVARSGLQVGDIITEMDGQSTKTAEEVTEFLKEKNPGDTVKMTVFRVTDIGESQTLTIDVVLAEDRGQSTTNDIQGN